MNHTYTIELTDVENKALAHVARVPQEWIENAIKLRCKKAIDEIYKKEVERMIADPTIESIPADKEQIVLNADIKTAQQIHDDALAQIDTMKDT